MARARNIKPSFFTNEILGTLDPIIGMTFIGLWCLADKEGILEDRPLRIKAELFPYRDSLDINGYLTVLERSGFVCRYVVDGKGYIQIINFEKHQHPHHTEKPKGYPKPQASDRERSLTPLSNGDTPSDLLIPDSLIPDSLIPVQQPAQPAAKPKAKRFDPLGVDLPTCIPRETWERWISYRRSRRLTCTEETIKAQVTELITWASSGQRPEDVINQSINKGWQGLFELKSIRPAQSQSRNPSYGDQLLGASRAIFGNECEGEGNGNIIDITPTVTPTRLLG